MQFSLFYTPKFTKCPHVASPKSIICSTSDRLCCLVSLVEAAVQGSNWFVSIPVSWSALSAFTVTSTTAIQPTTERSEQYSILHSGSVETFHFPGMQFCEHFKIIKVLTYFESIFNSY